jgi:hypothetical protein
MEVKIHILFCGDNSLNAALRQITFVAVKDNKYTYKFYLTKHLNMEMVRHFGLCCDKH